MPGKRGKPGKKGCRGRSKSNFLAITNTGSLIIVAGRKKSIERPKERIKTNTKDTEKKNKNDVYKVSWRGNTCAKETCKFPVSKNNSKNKSKRDSKKRSRKKPEKTSRKKNREKNREKKPDKNREGKNAIKYYLYYELPNPTNIDDIDAAWHHPPRWQKHKPHKEKNP